MSQVITPNQDNGTEVRSVLDAELAQLPEKWRLPLILCYLEGRTQDQAADHLDWSKNTLRRRLEEARAALGRRLKWRGVTGPAALSALLLSDRVASAALPPGLIGSTIEAVTLFTAGETAAISAKIVALTEGVLKTMLLTKLKTALAVLLGLVFLGTLGGGFAQLWAEKQSHLADGKEKPSDLVRVMVQDYEKASSLPKVWVVGIPNENASVQLSTDNPFEGKQCLKLHYHFIGGGQYLGITNAVKIQAPIHKLHFMLLGDNSGSGYGIYLTDASGETHKYRNPETMKIDFKGWKEMVIDLDAGHETWGGDKNGKIDYPVTAVTYEVSPGQKPLESDLFFDALSVDSEKSAEETLGCQVAVLGPGYCSDVKGDTTVNLAAPGFKTLTAKCWKPGGAFGSDSTIATVALDVKGNGSFVFPADRYPHGPITVRISGKNGNVKDTCYLQLYNKGGISWNEGMPKDPPAAKGMKLIFADDFDGPLSISSTDPKAKYYDHKPPNGWQDFSVHVFSGHDSPKNPFARVDSYLRIRANDKTRSSGLISSLKSDGSGIKVSAPCYFECRFLGPNAIGTWPAFWLLTDFLTDYKVKGDKTPCDELDIIEAYGGEGPGSPNAGDLYMVTPHCWLQGDAGKALEKQAYEGMHNPIAMHKFGIPSTWFEAFHTYGCKITETDTIYYCDNIEVGRHATFPLSKKQPLFFLINLATGGGWPVDLSRYGMTDMYIDYVRVYQQAP